MNAINAVLDKVRDLLQGEPARAISYGAVAVVWLVTHLAFALGVVHTPPPAFDGILAAVTGAIALLTEGIRMFVSSPATVAVLQDEAATSIDPGPVGVDPTPVLVDEPAQG